MAVAAGTVFEARLGGVARWMTIAACLALGAMMVVGTIELVRDPAFGRPWLMIGLPAVVLATCWAWRPIGYAIDEGGIHVLRPIGRKRIAAVDAEAVPGDGALAFALRLFGNGGVFGITGWFRIRGHGTCRAWVTDTSMMVMLHSEGRTVLVSPLDRERFMRSVGPASGAGLSTGARHG